MGNRDNFSFWRKDGELVEEACLFVVSSWLGVGWGCSRHILVIGKNPFAVVA